MMTEHLPILRRVGWLLVAVGIIDIGFMVYCIVNQYSYSSSLNIFAVIAGILLLRGHLATAGVVTWFSAFLLSALLLGLLAIFPWLLPADYLLMLIWRHPFGSLVSVIFSAASLWMLFWIYKELRLPAVIEARAAAGHKRSAPRSAFFAGIALALFLGVMFHLILNGKTAQKAKRLAAEQPGSEYKYFVSNIKWSGRHVSAQLTAYKENETKKVAVEWEQ